MTVLFPIFQNDMPKIRKEYKKKYGSELADDLEDESNHTTVGVLKAIILKNPPQRKVNFKN